MDSKIIIQYILYISTLLIIAYPLGNYIADVAEGKFTFLRKFEKYTYRIMGVVPEEEMGWKEYAMESLRLGMVSFLFVFIMLISQGFLPFNPQNFGNVRPDLAINIAMSFVTNTNWQAYKGELLLSNFSQMVALVTQNFISPAIGLVVCFALIKGLYFREKEKLGNFWVDFIRILIYILLPLSLIVSLILVSQGVVQNFNTTNINMIGGPIASQVAIKVLGSNGGGYFGANSSSSFENPNALTDFVQQLSILLIPTATFFSFGKMIKAKKQGMVILSTALVMLTVAFFIVVWSETSLYQQFEGVISSGNLEGKEVRNGIVSSSMWATITTATSNGSVNSMHSSFTPLSTLVMMFLMLTGEVIFGGVGVGFIGILAFVMVTVFISGLMIGRTPEYLGNKIELFEIKMLSIIVLIPQIIVLIGIAVATKWGGLEKYLGNMGAHGFSEILYNFASAGNNNGSSFAGFNGDNLFINLCFAIIMFLGRYAPIVASLALAGSLAKKRHIAVSSGTLRTDNVMFSIMLLGIILLVGVLSFFPALTLGPIAELTENMGVLN